MKDLDKLKKHVSASAIDGTGTNLNQMLTDLGLFGDPLLTKTSYIESYWYCKIDMFVSGDGITFEVKSDNESTPDAAVYGCIRKIVTTLGKMGVVYEDYAMALVKKGKLKYLSYMAWIGGIALVLLHGGVYGIIGLILVLLGDWVDKIDGDTGWVEHDTKGQT